MQFHIRCVDKADSGQVRADTRGDHLAYMGSFSDQVILAGPTLSDDGESMTGSVILLEVPDRAAAEAFSADDPYNKAGLFESVQITRFRKTVPAG